eukprot:425414-Prymnesium_polylepis.1
MSCRPSAARAVSTTSRRERAGGVAVEGCGFAAPGGRIERARTNEIRASAGTVYRPARDS